MEQSFFKRMLALLLCLVMAFSTVSTALAIELPPKKDEINYVSLGDSMTNGYGLAGYEYGEGTNAKRVNGFRQNDVTETYAALLAKYLGGDGEDWKDKVNWEALAISGMRTEDINFLLRYHTKDNEWNTLVQNLSSEYRWGHDTDTAWNSTVKNQWENTFRDDGKVIGDFFTFDEFVSLRCKDWGDAENGDEGTAGTENYYPWQTNPTLAYAQYFQNAVKDADVITLGAGNANFGAIMFSNLIGLLTGNAFERYRGDPASITDLIQRRFPEAISGTAVEILEKVNNAVAPYLAVLGEGKAEKVLNLVEYTTVSFMISYMDMLDAIDKLNNKENLDIIMMGLMNPLDGMKVNLGGGKSLDLGAMVDALTGVLSIYYFTLPVLRQVIGNDYKNITFYIVPDDSPTGKLVSEMDTEEKIKGNSIVRERVIDGVKGVIFNLVQGPLNNALYGMGFTLGSLDSNILNDYEELQKAYTEWTRESNFARNLTNKDNALAAAVYVAFEKAIAKYAGNATFDINSLTALIGGVDGLASMFDPIVDVLTSALGDDAQVELASNVADSVAAQLVASGKAQKNTDVIKTAIETQITALEGIEQAAQLKTALEAIKEQEIVPAGEWYSYSIASASDIATVLADFKDQIDAPTALFTAIELTKTLSDALGTALTEGEAANSIGGLLSLYSRMIIGEGVGVHPNADGHNTLFEGILEVYPDKPARVFLTERLGQNSCEVIKFLKKHGNELPEKISEIYEYAVDIELIPPEVQETIANAITTIQQVAATVEKVVEVERKVLRGVATVAVVGGVTYLGVSAVRHMVDKYQAANSQSEMAVSINTVSDAQQWLNENYDAGLTVDGGYGNMTKQAIVKALQKELGFTGADVDGVAGQKTLSALPELNSDSQGNTAVLLQCLLMGSGYGNDVEQAVLALQKAQGMAQTGVCDSQVWKALLD